MGEVWESQHATLRRPVALKLVRIAGEMRVRLLYEARVLANLRHPAIVAVHDAGVTDDGIGYLAMDVLDGESLASRIARRPLPVLDAVALFVELLGGLEAAHAAGIVHRDIKPDNVLLVGRDAASRPVLIDFGIAMAITADGTAPDRSGTPAYMAPEQLSGMASNERTDVWAASLSLYESVTGRVPFEGPDLAATTRFVLEAPLSFPTDVSALDGKLWGILTRGLRKDPEDRTATVRELRGSLADWLVSKTVPPTAPVAPTPRKREPSAFETLIRKKLTEG
jgi:eukaryotic-like serine/threonine-protein kinase